MDIITSIINEKKDNLWLLNMPKKYIPYWNSLNESNKSILIKQSKNHNLDTQYQIDTFWATRNIDLILLSKIKILMNQKI